MLVLLLVIFLILFVCLYLVDPHLGVQIVNSVKQQSGNPDRFLFHLFSMLGKLASIDGHVDRTEMAYVKRLEVELPEEIRQKIARYFSDAKGTSRSFDEYVDQFVEEFPNETELHLDILDCLVGLAFADGILRDSELRALQVASETFRVPSGSFKVVFERHTRRNERRMAEKAANASPPPPKVEVEDLWPYEILGLKPTNSIAEIKARYRKLVFEYHPDSASLRGVAPEVRKLSEQRFRELKEAYEAIRIKKSF